MGKRKNETKAALESPRYRKFITARDRALEVLLNKARAQIHDVLRGTFMAVREKVAVAFSTVTPLTSTVDGSHFLGAIDKQIEQEFSKAANLIGGIQLRLRMHAYTLAMAGEAEAIGQALDTMVKVEVIRDDVMEYAVTDFAPMAKRIQYAFDKLRRKLLNAVQLSRLEGSTVADTLERIDRALPAGAYVKRPKRVLKPIKEAEQPATLDLTVAGPRGKLDLAQGFYDDALWNDVINDYLKEFVPTYRFRAPDPDTDYQYKGFEIERDMTHDFVKTVRDAAAKGAAINGITDFQWIAVIDEHTCTACCGDYGCGDFDTLSTKQIEKMTKGEYSVPPAHFNCRCTIAPLLEDMPESPESNAKEFEEWLNS